MFLLNLQTQLFCYAIIAFLCLHCSSKKAPESADANTSEPQPDASDTDTSKLQPDASDTDTSEQVCTPKIDTSESDWVTIPAGTFIFGSPEDTPCRGRYTEKQVEVTITRPFRMSSTEVTQSQWEATCIPNPARNLGPNKPTGFVNWFEALAYCNKLSEAAGLEKCYDLSSCKGVLGGGCPSYCPESCFTRDKCEDEWTYCIEDMYICSGEVHNFKKYSDCPGYRLPTAAEWEYAAKAGTTEHNYNGNLVDDEDEGAAAINNAVLDPIAWYRENSGRELHPVGEKLPNPWGLYDVFGNAGEWVDYIFNARGLEAAEGKKGPLVDPSGGISGDIFGENPFRDMRGGHVSTPTCILHNSYQFARMPDIRGQAYGFRPVRTLFEK